MMQRALSATQEAPSVSRAAEQTGFHGWAVGRYAIFLLISAVVVAAGAWVRVDVQAQRKDLERVRRATVEASVLNDRLLLERDARRRMMALEPRATAAGLGQQAKLVDVHLGRAEARR